MADVRDAIAAVAHEFGKDRNERAARTALDRNDFEHLADAGFLRVGVPATMGGLWTNVAGIVRGYCELVREIARADPSVALVASMHPAVLAFWLAADDGSLRPQAERFFETALAGHWWGTVISEPGSGGDPMRTRTRARRENDRWLLTGTKHFGSGSGVTSFMITMARADDEPEPDVFVIDMRERKWDGSTGLRMTRAWDGHGMMATQSHAFELRDCAAERSAAANLYAASAPIVGQLTPLLFTAVIMGVLDSAAELARGTIGARVAGLRAYERVAWTETSNELWLAEQAFEGALRSVESNHRGALAAARAKLTVAGLAESALARLGRVVGGASYSRGQPFGQWGQDVRALGFLRPPWGYAFDQLIALEFVD